MNIFMANPTVTVGLISFISAQIIKTALFAIKQKTFNPERITGAGGMPSSHSALVVSVALYLQRLLLLLLLLQKVRIAQIGRASCRERV